MRKSRARNYRSHFSVHILPFHGDVRLSDYGVTHIRDLRLHLIEEKKISLKSAKNVIGASLKALFRDARAFGKIDKNPFLDLPREWWPRVVTAEPDPFTEAERDKITEYFFKKYWQSWPQGFVFVYALFWGGQRPSELTARRWRDIDVSTGMLSITTSRTEGEEGAPKTANSRRSIQLLRPVVEYLAQIKPLRAQPDDYIFTDQRGEPINQWKFSEQFQGALTALKIRHRDFYHTRHTFISVMLTHGENPKRIAEYVGNSPEVIYRNYGKWLGDTSGFGNAALLAAKPKPLPKPFAGSTAGFEQFPLVGLVRGAGFEPARRFRH
ncbi:MAG: hypothetical protein FJ145_26525 [Deltaproteobacteria bacterium]|nr:hypothetical protein [Deltaproteobacteria bacterium]